jgi:hypothetical protein
MKREPIPLWKVGATAGGAALTGTAVWLNAEHAAMSEGWFSPLVLAGIFVTLCAAATPPFAERAAKTGQPVKAAALWLFFALAVSFSLTASITRAGGNRDAQTAATQQHNIKSRLANEAYETAVANRVAECASGRGPRCRAAEVTLAEARRVLGQAEAIRSADPAAQRLAVLFGVSEASIALYSPLALPLGSELGGFVFLATGLSPRSNKRDLRPKRARRKDKAKVGCQRRKLVEPSRLAA